MADIDDDGDMDLLVGDTNGYITLFIRNEDGELNSNGYIQADDQDLDVGYRCAPQTVDWDNDGDLDLVIGATAAVLYLFINEGDAEQYNFTAAGTIQADGQEIWMGSETAPVFADLDGDDKTDLILGSIFGELWFYPNIGEEGEMVFGASQQVMDENGGLYVGNYSRPEIVDWDGDGDLDIITGTISPEIRLFTNPFEVSVGEEPVQAPHTFPIVHSYPEPFNGCVTISVNSFIPVNGTINILDLRGAILGTFGSGLLTTGNHNITLPLNDYPSGRYFIRFESDGFSSLKPITLVR